MLVQGFKDVPGPIKLAAMQIAKNMKQCKLHPRLGPKRFFALALYLALKFSTLHGKILNDAMIKRIV